MTRSLIFNSAALAAIATLSAVPAALSAQAPRQTTMAAERPFLNDSDAAMSRMMSAMEPKPTGDVDRDFAAMMIPHHQGAIDMAESELKFGHDDQLRRIAQEIIVDQQQEIAAMRLALDRPHAASAASGGDRPSSDPRSTSRAMIKMEQSR